MPHVRQMNRLVGTIALLVLDLLWIRLFMGSQYKNLILNIQGMPLEYKTLPAVLAYLFMTLGLQVFVLESKTNGLLRAFLFGLILYGVFDCTCAAVIEKWDMKLAIVDVLWGGFVFGASYLTANAF